jgi:hypothetical protein
MLIRKGEVKEALGLLTPAHGSEKHSVTRLQHTERVRACGPNATVWLQDCLLLACLMCLFCHSLNRVPPVTYMPQPCPLTASSSKLALRYTKD